MSKHELVLDSEHKYWRDGQRIPGVSEIIQAVFPYEGHGLASERAREFGKVVHKVIELETKGVLDPSTVDPAIQPYLDQFQNFRCEYNIPKTQCKTEIMLHTKEYAGTIDLVTQDLIVDVKTGQKLPTHRLQVAGYRKLWNANSHKNKRKKAIVVYLNGSDKMPEIVEEKPEDLGVFLSCLSIKKWKELNNVK